MSTRITYHFPAWLGLVVILTSVLTAGGVPITAQRASLDDQLSFGANGDAFRSSPVMFIENAGQWPDAARFQVWGAPAGTMWLAEDAMWITVVERTSPLTPPLQREGGKFPSSLPGDRRQTPPSIAGKGAGGLGPRAVNIKLSFIGANPHPLIEPFDRLDTKVSYFIGNDPDKWRPSVPVWGGVRYVDLYPGVDLEITSEDGRMVQRLAAQPGADLHGVRLRVEGADAVAVDGDALRLTTTASEAAQPLLLAEGARGAAVVEASGTQAFDVTAPFVSDSITQQSGPVSLRSPADNPAELLYGTFLGGGSDESGLAIAVDAIGSAYVTGWTQSGGFPTTPGILDPSYNGNTDAFVFKLNASGSGLAYATFLGGTGGDNGYDIQVNDAGNAFVTGSTQSPDFPTTPGAYDTTFSFNDAFVVKLDPDGAGLDYATLVDGCRGQAIAVDQAGSAYVTGLAGAAFPATAGAFDTTHNGGDDAFALKLNPSGSALVYATFLGGSRSWELGRAIAVDSTGRAIVVGDTESTNFPTTSGAYDRSHNGWADVFITKLNATGSALVFSTFLGGTGTDRGYGIALDAAGAAYVTGFAGADFPKTAGAFRDCPPTIAKGYVTKLNSSGSGLVYSTCLGGSSDYQSAYGIAVDAGGRAVVTGGTSNANYPVTANAYDTSHNGQYDAFVTMLNYSGSGLVYGTFLGGGAEDRGWSLAVDEAGRVYVSGFTTSSDFSTTAGAFDRSYNSGGDAFVVKLAMGIPPTYTISGRVTDANGAAIPGVTVWAGFPLNTTTDANGNYTFTGLPAGTYTITPDKDNYTFFPIAHTITIPPSAESTNFTGELGIDFRPTPNGYRFCNGPTNRSCDEGWGRYPNPPTNGDFTPDDMVRMFGADAVCQTGGDTCQLTLVASVWLDWVNHGMNQGHCFGMASTSLRFFKGLGGDEEDQPSDFQPGAQTTHDLSLSSIRRHIAYYHVLQATSPLSARIALQQVYNPPSHIMDSLRSALAGEAADPMVLILSDWGVELSPNLIWTKAHAITPYALHQQDANTWLVRVYDNNYPDNQNLYLTINTVTETWDYPGYSGDSSVDALAAVPMSWLDERPTCPFCNLVASTASQTTTGQVWNFGPSHLLITDSAGRRLGYMEDQPVNEIPNAYETVFAGGLGTDTELIYTIPLTDTYTIMVDGHGLASPATTDVAQFGPGYAVQIQNLPVSSVTRDELSIANDGSKLLYRASEDKEATLALAQDGASESYQFKLSAVDLLIGQPVALTNDINAGRLAFANSQRASNSYDLAITRVSGAAGVTRFYHADLRAAPGDVQSFDYRAWDGVSPLVMQIDRSGDGTIDETRILENQIRTVYLPIIRR